jgi:hypothetical protein
MNSWHIAIGTLVQNAKAVIANAKERLILLETMVAEQMTADRMGI